MPEACAGLVISVLLLVVIHNRSLDLEYQKAKPNAAVVKELIQITFAMRRRVILSDQSAHNIQKYPFLQSPELVSILCISVIMHVFVHDIQSIQISIIISFKTHDMFNSYYAI